METLVFCDASVHRHRGMGFAWVAVVDGQKVAQGGGRITICENPDFGSTTAEAIGMLAAVKATEQYPNRVFFSDSESLALLTLKRKPSANARLAKMVEKLPLIQFNNQSPFLKEVDRCSKKSHIYERITVMDQIK